LFVNGVEIYSYKSSDKVYYGPIQSISVLNAGFDYDVINPPRLSVYQDGHSGVGASVIAHVSGTIKEILVDTEGLDYISAPSVYISGGNGSATAEAKMKLVPHQVDFDSTSTGGIVNTTTDKFTFTEAHGFKHGEEIIYETRGTTPIGIGTTPGTLINGASYFVIKNNDYTISLAETRQKSLVGIATLDIISNGEGFHSFYTKERRLKVDKIYAIKSSVFYNKETTTTPVGINTFTDIITINNHGYNSGEELKYSTTGLAIGGLSTTTKYYAIKVDSNQFRVSISTSLTNYVGLTSIGSGYHIFNYPPITVTLSGSQGITTSNATATPIVRGSISSVHVKNSGSDFGSTIINDNYKPEIKIIEGSNASLRPFIINGKLDSVIVKSGGLNYFSVPDIIISGDGVGAKAKANILNGQIISVDIIDSGIGYSENSTVITATTPGEGAIFSSNLKEWKINQVERYAKIGDVNSDDGFYESMRSSKLGNPYVNYYVPRNLRNFLNDTGIQHSPILGYAYDGSPIYGPYAYTNIDGTGPLKYLQSSYVKISGARVDGPDILQYPIGFFVEDYNYVQGSGDLDEHNGRFAITPEYPNGVYAYYTTVSSSVISNSGNPFNGARQPEFPYVIGNTYNFSPNIFNYDYNSTQDIDPVSLNLIRNTNSYKINDGYEFISNTIKNTFVQSKISKIKFGSVEKIDVVESGINYNVNDKIIFDNTNTSGFGAIAKISKIVGVGVTNITSTTTSVNNLTLVCNNNTVTAISTQPHNFIDGSYVSIVGIGSTVFNKLGGTHRINVQSVRSGLGTSMKIVGLTSSLYIKDSVTKFEVNDILKVDDEQFLVMSIDRPNNRLNLLRNYNGTVGQAHTAGAEITRLETKFTYELDNVVNLSTPKNETVFFDASSVVGVGLSYGVGIGTTISYIGAGDTTKSIFIPTRSIFLPDNPLVHGEEVFYSPGAGTSLTYSLNGSTTFPMPSKMYVQKLTKDLIALTTAKTGINSDLSRVFFNGNIGIGNSHSFTTRRNIVSCDVETVNVVVSTASSHGLRPDDTIDLTVVSTATSSVSASYNSITRFVSIASSINPNLNVSLGDYLEFDVSDPSLLNTKLDFFLDKNYTKKFVGSGVSSLEITNKFAPGITSATTTIHFTEKVPSVLYYKFTSLIPTKIIEINKDIDNFSKIIVNPSKFTGTHSLTTTTNQSFTFNIFEVPERIGYTSASHISYITNSTNVSGPIAKVSVLDGGKNYKSLPKVSVSSTSGSSASLRPYGSNIGSIDTVKIIDFGYDYSSDKTLRPQASVPQVILLKDNYTIDSVAITSTGSKYLVAPDLIVYNRKTNTINTQSSVVAKLSGNSVGSVNINDAGGNLKSTDNYIIAINNTNGVGIISATYSYPTVTLRLQTPITGFTTSNPLPFAVGDQIFVENIGVSTGKGYNSSEYGYRYWDITGVNTAFGLVNQATISYSLNENPGVHDGLQYGTVSNTKDIAKFNLTLREGEFYNGEEVYTNSVSTNVISGNGNVTNILRVNSLVGLNTGDLIKGRVSGSSGIIESMQNYSGSFDVNSSLSKDFGWEKDTGKLNDFFQRIHDSNYYQQFSYSLKSKIGITSWSEPVDSLAHIAGFKKHSDLLIPSDSLSGVGSTSISVGVGTQSSTIILVTPDPIKMYCKHDWDLVYEKTNNDATISDKVVFHSNRFGDALICKSNRVLEIDDISPQFYSDPDISRTIEIDSFDINQTSAVKYYAQIVLDTSLGISFNETQYTEFVVSHDGTVSFNNQYSDLSDAFDLGDFSTSISGTTISILFSPYNTTYSYDITFYKEKIDPFVGVGATSFGHIKKVGVSSFIAASGSPTEQIIQAIDANQFKSGSVIVSVIGIESKNIVEASFLGIGSTCQYIEFGKMDNGINLGTFSANMTGTNDLHLKWIPAIGVGVTVAMLSTLVGVATTVPGGIAGTSREVGDASLNCTRTGIISSATPSAETIAIIPSTSYTSVKYMVEIYNVTDGDYSFFHITANVYGDVVNYIKYNNLSTSVDTRRDIQNIDMTVSGTNALLRFTPRANKEYIVRTSEIRIDKPDDVASDVVITLL
jgi:YHYH protein